MTLEEIQKTVNECLGQLFKRDFSLLEHDVSERAITHKLAEYLQDQFSDLNVDCEYNRNTTAGDFATKELYILNEVRKKRIASDLGESKDEDHLLAISTYPDIIVHRRNTNDRNLLVIEVKKKNSKIGPDYDHQKLKAFTDRSEQIPYHYSYGVFILIKTGSKKPQPPELTWFIEGNNL